MLPQRTSPLICRAGGVVGRAGAPALPGRVTGPAAPARPPQLAPPGELLFTLRATKCTLLPQMEDSTVTCLLVRMHHASSPSMPCTG